MLQQIELQSVTAQDMVRVGREQGRGDWMVVADGHGNGRVIKTLRQIDWSNAMRRGEPFDVVRSAVSTLPDTRNDGATLTTVKIDAAGIHVAWMGDSQVRVYRDEVEVWQSPNHNAKEPNGLRTTPTWTMSVVDDKHITMRPSNYFVIGDMNKLAVNRALGHNGVLSSIPQTHTIDFRQSSTKQSGAKQSTKHRWKVVVATDGVWDMMCDQDTPFLASPDVGVDAIANLAARRWGQEWTYVHPPPEKRTSQEFISDSRDDIGVAIWYSIR